MAIKNNDDVAHLLDATGRTGTAYREFEGASEQASAPLIDAIFGKDPPSPNREEKPLGIGSDSGGDLLADVFDRAPPIVGPLPADRGGRLYEDPKPHSPVGTRASAPALLGSRRTLNDIRRIITQPVDETATAPSTDSLNGLFDRLAG